METLFARALFDNTSECKDELAFRKGDIIAVLERSMAGSIGWWRCSLDGRQGLAPANRLCLLSPAQAEELRVNLTDFPGKHQKIHQKIHPPLKPSTPLAADPLYEDMNTLRRLANPHIHSTDKHTPQDDAEESGFCASRDVLTAPVRTGSELYDVPSLVRGASVFTPSTPEPLQRKTWLMSTMEIQKRYDMLQSRKCTAANSKTVCGVPSLASKDPNYDIPVPSITEDSKKPRFGYSTMPNPSKSEWIYDVPVFMQKQSREPGHYDTLPPRRNPPTQLYDVLPARVRLKETNAVTEPIYDVPKLSRAVPACIDNESSTYKVPPCPKETEMSAKSALPRQRCSPESDSKRNFEPFEYRSKSRSTYDQLHRWPSRGRSLFRQPAKEAIRKTDEEDNQRCSTVSTSSTASSSSSSSCDSFLRSSPEPESLCEVHLSQEEAGRRLLELQAAVCRSVPKLMLFVSSQWKSKEHLGEHLHQIRTAIQEVTDSVSRFLKFALDVRGNAQRLTDANLQTRLLKQFSVVEDSGLILQQAADALRDLGWLLDTLAEDAGQSQTHDHLERFVMVARTVPEDVTRLVSILNANGKLLFRGSAREADVAEQNEMKSSSESTEDSGIDDSDYIQLQTTTEESDQQPKTAKSSFKPKTNDFKPKTNDDTVIKQACTSQSLSSGPLQTSGKPSISDHCRLYFGAIQKAIGAFVSSLNDGQPPEKFVSHSKLVIMVGQRLVRTLCSETKKRESSREMLSMTNQLCVHFKQLAMVTKKAAFNFPDKLALQEAQDVATELARRAQHFRMSLDV